MDGPLTCSVTHTWQILREKPGTSTVRPDRLAVGHEISVL